VRIDSTVVEADVRYPSDAALSLDGARTLAREARKLTALVGAGAGRVRDRSRALGRRLRAISRTLGGRTGERKAQVLALTEQAGELLSRSLREARRLDASRWVSASARAEIDSMWATMRRSRGWSAIKHTDTPRGGGFTRTRVRRQVV
jgi:IS5 family transposase